MSRFLFKRAVGLASSMADMWDALHKLESPYTSSLLGCCEPPRPQPTKLRCLVVGGQRNCLTRLFLPFQWAHKHVMSSFLFLVQVLLT